MIRRVLLAAFAVCGSAAGAPAQPVPRPAVGPAPGIFVPGPIVTVGPRVAVVPVGLAGFGLREVRLKVLPGARPPVPAVPVRWRLGAEVVGTPGGAQITRIAPGSGLLALRAGPGGVGIAVPIHAEPGDVIVAVEGELVPNYPAYLRALNTAADPRDVQLVLRNRRDGRLYLAYATAAPAR